MSKEQEAYQQRTAGQPQGGSNPQPVPPAFRSDQYGPSQQTAAYPGVTYNTSTPGPVVPGPVAAPVYPQFHGATQAKKSVVEAYILWLILGLLGAHHFYLRVRIYIFI